jgi:hypothetical protein
MVRSIPAASTALPRVYCQKVKSSTRDFPHLEKAGALSGLGGPLDPRRLATCGQEVSSRGREWLVDIDASAFKSERGIDCLDHAYYV